MTMKTGTIPVYPEAFLRTATDSPEELLFQSAGRIPDTRTGRLSTGIRCSCRQLCTYRRRTTEQNGYARGRTQGRTNAPQGNVPQNGYRQPQNGYAPNPGSAPNYAQGNPNQQPSGGYAPGNGAAPGTQGGYPGDGFTQVTEQQAETLPFVA